MLFRLQEIAMNIDYKRIDYKSLSNDYRLLFEFADFMQYVIIDTVDYRAQLKRGEYNSTPNDLIFISKCLAKYRRTLNSCKKHLKTDDINLLRAIKYTGGFYCTEKLTNFLKEINFE